MTHRRSAFVAAGALLLVVLLGTTALEGPAQGGVSTALEQLGRTRVEAAAKAYSAHDALYRGGQGSVDSVYRWSLRWHRAATSTQTSAPSAHVARMRALLEHVQARVAGGEAPAADQAAAAYYVAEAVYFAAGGR